MCGIFGLIEDAIIPDEHTKEQVVDNYKYVLTNATQLLTHRGPDSYGNKLIIDPGFKKSILMIHTRLKINGNDTVQPLVSNDNSMYLIINGEIFNWKELEKELDYKCTSSDCEIVFPLYQKYKNNIPKMLKKLNGQFSFVLYDLHNKHVLIARDPIGVTPLYFGYKHSYKTRSGKEKIINRFAISSELKCLTMIDKTNYGDDPCNENESFVSSIKVFYPRSYIYAPIEHLEKNYVDHMHNYTNFYDEYNTIQNTPNPLFYTRDFNIITENIRKLLYNSVYKRLEDLVKQNVEFGVLLSGGLDSSLISSLVSSIATDLGYTKKIRTFSIGVNESVPDLVAARKVADFLNTDHKEYYFTTQQGIDNLENVILFAESYDCTTIRASTPMYLLTKSIRQDFPNIKVLFSGELSDELLCYLYGANAPSETDFQSETVNLVSNVHLFDCLRANKMCMAHSFEVRVPFTDIDYVEYILSLHPSWKNFGPKSQNKIEKQILRDSFHGYLPKNILYRKKEQFSDGVSCLDNPKQNWIDSVTEYANNIYTNELFQTRSHLYTQNRPTTKEQLLYRDIFCKFFNDTSYKNTSEFTVKQWEPKWSLTKDPSGRKQTYWNPN
jgi:asparagine synthase (glutamine-hydrolysing)